MYSTFSTNRSSNGSRSGRQDSFKKGTHVQSLKSTSTTHSTRSFRFQSSRENVSYFAGRDDVDF